MSSSTSRQRVLGAGRFPWREISGGGASSWSTVWHTDIVVVGSGAAGLTAALAAEASGAGVMLITKTGLVGGSSPLAQGGMAAALGSDDGPALHAADTLRVGRGLCDLEVVRLLADSGPEEIRKLREWGARFDLENGQQTDGQQAGGELSDRRLALGREGGHSRNRIVHAGGDATGAELVRTLVDQVRGRPGMEVIEHLFADDLLVAVENDGRGLAVDVDGGRRVVGISARDDDGERIAIFARAVVLATGGAGQLYRYTTNPVEVTGDGIAMAARAGARLADLEMVQFHPTALCLDGATGSLPLLTEALRGAGAHLVDGEGQRFMPAVHESAELAPRDVVARTLWMRSAAGLDSFLDLRPIEDLAVRFPTAMRSCLGAGLDPREVPVPVTPAAHYLMGGVWTDREGRASLPGLWACGETAATGAHGANRLASNSLLEAVVFGARVVESILGEGLAGANQPARLEPRGATWAPRELDVEGRRELADLMWRGAGVVRSGAHLAETADALEQLPATNDPELANLRLVGRLVVASALRREESRGSHYRQDFPETDPDWRRRQTATLAELLGPVERREPGRSVGGSRAAVRVQGS